MIRYAPFDAFLYVSLRLPQEIGDNSYLAGVRYLSCLRYPAFKGNCNQRAVDDEREHELIVRPMFLPRIIRIHKLRFADVSPKAEKSIGTITSCISCKKTALKSLVHPVFLPNFGIIGEEVAVMSVL